MRRGEFYVSLAKALSAHLNFQCGGKERFDSAEKLELQPWKAEMSELVWVSEEKVAQSRLVSC